MKKFSLFFACVFVALRLFAQDYTQLYLVGSASAAGWDANNAVPMTLVEGSDAVYKWTGKMNSGEFKFINAKGSWSNGFTALSPTTVTVGQTYSLLFNSTDNKFTVSTSEIYSVTVDMKKLKMTFSKATFDTITELWAVGTALPSGKIKLVNDQGGVPNQFKYNGELIAGGSLSFTTTETEDAQTNYYVPITGNKEVVGLSYSKLVNSASDAGWSVATANKMYKLKLDLISNALNAEIYKPRDSLFIVGTAATAGWNAAKAIPFTVDTLPYLYTYEGDLVASGSGDQFKILGQRTGWGPYSLHPITFDEPVLESAGYIENTGDDKWIVNYGQKGKYIIKVDLFHETINATFNGTTTSIAPITNSVLNSNNQDLFNAKL